MSEAMQCPICGAPPDVDRCEPWPACEGPAPWYATHYSLTPYEHTFGGNGDTRDQAIAEWNRLVIASAIRSQGSE